MPSIVNQEFTKVRLDEVKPHPRNPRQGDIGAIYESICANGFYGALIVQKSTGFVLAGNHRRLAAAEANMVELPAIVVDCDDDTALRILLADNRTNDLASYDLQGLSEILTDIVNEHGVAGLEGTGYDGDALDELLKDLANAPEESGDGEKVEATPGALADRFIVPPFSVLDQRQGYWQTRKKAWIELGVKGEAGRAGFTEDGAEALDALIDSGSSDSGPDGGIFSPSSVPVHVMRAKEAYDKSRGSKSTWKDFYAANPELYSQLRTSVFDPVIVEIALRWFNVPGGSILDPFAGECTKGVVSEKLGYAYTGVELREDQVEINRSIASRIGVEPNWIAGDSSTLDKLLPKGEAYDLVFTSPPYYDLEIYSESEKDGSAFETYDKFMEWYELIFSQAVNRLRDNRFLVVKVGDVRDDAGSYYGFVADNIRLFQRLGLSFYNEAIMVSPVGSLAIRVAKQFTGSRKLGKTHQQLLVFYKGDVTKIKDHFPQEIEHGDLESEEAQG